MAAESKPSAFEAVFAAYAVVATCALGFLHWARLEKQGPAPEEATDSSSWLVLLATLPGDDLKAAEDVANAKLRAARELGMTSQVSVYKTRLKGRYVVVLGGPLGRSAAIAAAAEARRRSLSPDAFAQPLGGWELTGSAPFDLQVRSASAG